MTFFILYVALLLLLSLRCRNADRTQYYVNGRQSSAFTVALSIVASCVGGSATLGMAGLAFQVGTPAFWWLGSGAVGLVVLSLFLARKVRQSGALTMPELLADYLGAPCRPLASVIIVLAWLAILAAQFTAMAAVIAPLTGLGQHASLSLGAFILVAYTLAGGQAAVMKSDVWQYGILLAALLTALAFACAADGGKALTSVTFEVVNADFPASRLHYYLCILGGSYVVCPMLFGRLLSARDAAAARRGALWAVLGLTFTAALIVALGIACRGLVPAGTPPEQVLGAALLSRVPSWLATLILLGIFSAIISSADSCLMTAASVVAGDILRKPDVHVCRCAMAVLGGAGVALALSGQGILALLLAANDIYVCGVVPPVLVGMLRGKDSVHPWGAAFAMLGGGALGCVAAIAGLSEYAYAGLGFSLFFSLLAVRSGSVASTCPQESAVGLRRP
ncbi:MAG: hypothetical protein LBN33_03210 [Desulfovibrio sp.]|jgi:SSS family solute:Na+ symporter|nr:hypothetical protein [Desulfovibrio sp.]